MPEVGERLCYTTLSDMFMPAGAFPTPEETPWTNGGPPAARADDGPAASDGDRPRNGPEVAGRPGAGGSKVTAGQGVRP